jgi:hypothetical protein
MNLLRIRVGVTPDCPLLIPFHPRDLYPLGPDGDPLLAKGRVEAAQRGLNSGLIYLTFDQPAFGSMLYFQNLTALNPYFATTETKPDGAVGGEWPELGYLLPSPPQSGTPPVHPLPAGRRTLLSDAILVFRDPGDLGETDSARHFLQMLGAVYRVIDRPETCYRDWPGRAQRTIDDLVRSPDATLRHYGHVYARPYVAAEYPDSMVHASLLSAIRDWDRWKESDTSLATDFAGGLDKFYDGRLGTLRRYLPNVGRDKNKDAVDSWYLYHPLVNLVRLALAGDKKAHRMVGKTIDFAIRAARHFDYKWPVQFRIDDFSIITATANDDRGQTDVGGLYAFLMLQMFRLTGEDRYVAEARRAIDIGKGMRFNLNYQANLTAWGAAACIQLWRVTGEAAYLSQSYVYLASFFHNSAIWESEIAGARDYHNFLGVTALQDAPYMAVFECFDSFAAFDHYLAEGGPDVDPAVRLLVSEYCRYALDRAWFYYPDALSPKLLSPKSRNGHIDRALSFPLEDLYVDGQPAGQVGQEIYGAGAAFVFATRSHHRIPDAPFELFCDQFVRSIERMGKKALSLQLDGGEDMEARLSVLRLKGRRLPRVRIQIFDGHIISVEQSIPERLDFVVPANGRLLLGWT